MFVPWTNSFATQPPPLQTKTPQKLPEEMNSHSEVKPFSVEREVNNHAACFLRGSRYSTSEKGYQKHHHIKNVKMEPFYQRSTTFLVRNNRPLSLRARDT